MLFTNYIKMATILDLPDDIFRYELFPYLRWQDRVNFNSILPNSYRVSTRMKKNKILYHEYYVITRYLIGIIDKSYEVVLPEDRVAYLTKMMTLYNTSERIISYISGQPLFKWLIMEKALEYSDVELTMRDSTDRNAAQRLSEVSLALFEKVSKIETQKHEGPYLPISVF